MKFTFKNKQKKNKNKTDFYPVPKFLLICAGFYVNVAQHVEEHVTVILL